jgi:PKD repeat protein
MKRSPVLLLCCAAVLLILAAFAAPPAQAQTCDRSGCGRASCATPARPVPADRWGALQPVDASLPVCTRFGPAFCRDSTAFNEFVEGYQALPWFMAMDAENGYLFAGLSHGLQVWDARNDPADPEPLSQLSFGGFPVWANNPEIKWPLQDVDAPDGVDDVVAVAGVAGIGIAVVNLSDKDEPEVAYQNHGKDGMQVYATTIGGRRYAFLAAVSGSPTGGLFAYDLTAARSFSGCAESVPTPGEDVQCPGVYLGRVGPRGSASFVHGVERFVAVSFGTGRGVEIWDAANPANPRLALSALGDRSVHGVALWKQGTRYLLAVRTDYFDAALGRTVRPTSIYDVSCITGTCSGLGAPLWSAELDSGGTPLITFSRSGSTPFLYLGSDNRCSGGVQREWLLDVSNPAAARDVTPPTGYWGWYYRGGPTGFNLVAPREGVFIGETFYRAALSIFDIHRLTGSTGGPVPILSVNGPASTQTGQLVTFNASAAGCSPTATGWTWTLTGGAMISGSATGPAIAVTWPNAGTWSVSASNAACGSAVATREVVVSTGSGNVLDARFSFSPPAPRPGQAVNFDAGTSSGNPSQFAWEFGDGTVGVGRTVSHTYSTPGAYTVRLTISRPGSGTGCVSGTCFDEAVRVVVVETTGPPPPSAAFTASVPCVLQFGFEQCSAAAGQAVTLTAEATGASSYSWSFGDGTQASGRSVSHTWSQAGSYPVVLTVTGPGGSATGTKLFVITGGGGPGPQPEPAPVVIVPWIAQTRGALVQSSDLYVHNPGSAPLTVTLEFRKRGAPEPNPPRATRTIAPGATLFVGDIVGDLFARENSAGMLMVTGEPDKPAPVVTSFNTTFQGASRFGQTVPGAILDSRPGVQHLVGLSDDGERLSYFGVSNPNDAPSTFRVRLFDSQGQAIGGPAEFTVARFGQRQFQVEEIRQRFGAAGERDYRVQIETLSGGPLFPYGAILRSASRDPSFVEASTVQPGRVYLVGALATPGIGGSLWRSDVVLSNPGTEALALDMTFINVGFASVAKPPVRLTLQPGQTLRLADVLSRWQLRDAVGVLTFESRSPSGALPIVQGESYDDARPARRFGQTVPPRTDEDAAGPGEEQVLTGLRQDAAYRTTLWLFNPSGQAGVYDLIYLALDGRELGRIEGYPVGAGKVRQLSPSQHPIPAAGVQGGFTVRAVVRSGRLLSAGQVVTNATNDPAYVRGETR